MKTQIFAQVDYKGAAELLKKAEVVAFPTETVFGMGIIYDSRLAFDRLVAAKRRPSDKPFSVMCADYEQIAQVAMLNDRIKKIMATFMPGAITLLLKPVAGLPEWVTLNQPTVGVRWPDFALAIDLIKEVGKPLLVPSANIAGEPPAKNSEEVIASFDGAIAGIIQGAALMEKPSTIVDLSQENIKLVREGCIPFAEIKKIWEEN